MKSEEIKQQRSASACIYMDEPIMEKNAFYIHTHQKKPHIPGRWAFCDQTYIIFLILPFE